MMRSSYGSRVQTVLEVLSNLTITNIQLPAWNLVSSSLLFLKLLWHRYMFWLSLWSTEFNNKLPKMLVIFAKFSIKKERRWMQILETLVDFIVSIISHRLKRFCSDIMQPPVEEIFPRGWLWLRQMNFCLITKRMMVLRKWAWLSLHPFIWSYLLYVCQMNEFASILVVLHINFYI